MARTGRAKIVVVGAGFAGCAVALYLEKHSDASVTVLEELLWSQDGGYGSSYGEIKLTKKAASIVFKSLEVKSKSYNGDEVLRSGGRLSRTGLLKDMRHALQKCDILSGCRFVSLKSQDDEKLVVLYSCGDDRVEKSIFDVDLVVAEDGLVSRCKAAARNMPRFQHSVLAVGDASRFFRLELDFSYRRVSRGACDAIENGCALGQLISEGQSLAPFSVAQHERERMLRRNVVIGLFVFLVAVWLQLSVRQPV